MLARLEHPNLARVTDRIQEGERHYIVMEFIEGQTLRKMLEGRSEPFPEEQVLVWADQLCDVLSYLHSREPKIIYRDMKPANVMVLDGAGSLK
ncbi:MAG: protein kinase, partial [Candidatus Aminicenantes bacterium]|nr:protein kinase [Candidatus Aminicenantes bacterium]